jgi:hypothetical protein
MTGLPECAEYLDEIREQVCSRCVERPPGGPPCAPLGKDCGVELHLPALVKAIHEVRSDTIAPYLEHDRQQICANCAFLHSSICPCPMDYLLVLIVDAVEKVDERKGCRAAIPRSKEMAQGGLQAIRGAYEEAAGVWTGCDWDTRFGG